MRIGMLTDMYKPHVSGVTNYIDLYRRRFEELGHEVVVVTFGNRTHDDADENVVRSPAVPWGRTGWQAGLGYSGDAVAAVRSCDILHAHHPFVSGPLGVRHRIPSSPIVFTNHTRYDLYSDTYASFAPQFLRHGVVRQSLRRFTQAIDMTLAPSPAIRDWLSEFGITDDAVVLNNSIDTAPFRSPASRFTADDFNLPSDSIIAVYLGRVGQEKNMSLLADAFIAAAAQVPDLALLVLGDGPARADIERTLANAGLSSRVHFTGTIPYSQAPAHLAAGDFFVTASVSETYPLVVMEAGAASLPCLGVNSPGVGEVVAQELSGILTEETPGAYANGMIALATDTALRERLSRGAIEASADHDIRITADTLMDHYERLIESRVALNPPLVL
ncbi:MAG: glycosyltransferase [Actinomycetota bacterium]|jgi:1,2-diacylglycerol 3-alpha-glucosyltransferase|nr:glycosyltransferase [Actinomycetota bacterium]